MKSCIKCQAYTSQLVNTDDYPFGIYICDPCLEIEINNTLNELVNEGLVIKTYDQQEQEDVYRLSKDV